MLSEISQTQKEILYDSTYINCLKESDTQKQRGEDMGGCQGLG